MRWPSVHTASRSPGLPSHAFCTDLEVLGGNRYAQLSSQLEGLSTINWETGTVVEWIHEPEWVASLGEAGGASYLPGHGLRE